MNTRILLCGALLLGASACDQAARYDRVNMYKVAGSVEADVEPGLLVVPRGGVLMFEAEPLSESGRREYTGMERFELFGTQPDVVGVRRSIRANSWVINGVRAGTATIVVELDGDPVDEIRVEVSE